MKTNIYKTNKRGSKDFWTSWNIYQKFLEVAKLNKEDKILDAGCGEGRLLNFFKGKHVYGIDQSQEAVQRAKSKGYFKVIKGELEKIPFEDKKFDKTVCIQVLHYVEKPEKVFEELLRVTKKQVIISVSNFNWFRLKMTLSKKWKKSYGEELKLHSNFTNADFLRMLASQHGVKVDIYFISNKGGLVRNLLGNHFSSEVIGVFRLRK